jgi:hypothetical protein
MEDEKMYYLMTNPKCNEIHIFEMKFIRIDNNKKIYGFYQKPDKLERYKCICKAYEYTRMAKITTISKSKLLGNEIDIRKECAEIGRPVCGICISSLYGTFPIE